MKITRLKLVNFIGVRDSLLDRDEIEIDLSENSNKIIMLNGKNGSGKTTVLSQFHPFKDSFDERKTLIVEGKEGIKEIDYDVDGIKYEIKHIMGKKTQSFIKKDGVELNENGGVRTFNDIVAKELGITPDYFKIGKIGTNTTNFIDLSTAERKNYISKFLPDIDEYLESFKLIKNKFSMSNDKLKQIAQSIEKLDTTDILSGKIEMCKTNIDLLDKNIEDKIKEIGSLLNIIENNNNVIKSININDVNSDIQNNSEELQKILDAGRAFISAQKENLSIEQLEDNISKFEKELIDIESDIKIKENDLDNIIKKNIEIKNKTNINNFKKSEISSLEDINDVLENIKNITNEIDKLKTENSKCDERFSKLTSDYQINQFQTFKNFMMKYANNLLDSTIVPTQQNIDFFMLDDAEEKLENYNKYNRDLYEENNTLLENKNKEKAKKEANLSKLDILNQRPAECSIDICPFIKDALQYKNLPEEIKELDSEIKSIKENLDKIEIKGDILTDNKFIYSSFISNYKSVDPNNNILYKYLIENKGSLKSSIENISEFDKFTQDIIDKANSFVLNNIKIKDLELKKSNLESKATIIKNNNNIIEMLDKDNENLKNDYLENQNKESLLKTSLEDLKNNKESLNIKINNFKGFLDGKKKYKEIDKKLKESKESKEKYDLNLKEYNNNSKLIDDLNNDLTNLKNKRTDFNNELTRLNTVKTKVDELTTERSELEKVYETQKYIKDALDPNKGIPLFFVQAYLNKTEAIANELLKIAYEEKFEISFKTNPSEFFIQVTTDRNFKNDIKDASQGEVALTTISISLALIEQSLSNYNILCLDEIDGPLDGDNREKFITILNKQIDKLGIEQVFVISHNNAFDSHPTGLILFPGHSVNTSDDFVMENKKIIFEA